MTQRVTPRSVIALGIASAFMLPIALVADQVAAADVVIMPRNASKDDFLKALDGKAAIQPPAPAAATTTRRAPSGGRTIDDLRGLSIGNAMAPAAPPPIARPAPASTATSAPPPSAAAPRAHAIGIRISFDSADAAIRPEWFTTLDNLAAALLEKLGPGHALVIEGHTDAKGSDAYNLDLSVRRADSVRSYLTQRGVPGDQMQALGKGESEPLPGTDPMAAGNRRVQFILQ
ncbi:MAG: OmpA family protein [Azospirillum sp.]|nr:OmpA family protein [Azospirillum sp.]